MGLEAFIEGGLGIVNDIDLAQSLFKKPAEVVKEAFGGRLPTYTVEAEAMADSEGGFVQVQFMGDTVNLTDGDPDGAGDVTDEAAESGEAAQWVEVPCSACIHAGDRVLVTIQDGAPIDCTAIGFGDALGAVADAAATLAQQAETLAQATAQNFWHDANGAHVSTTANDAEGERNILMNAYGILLRAYANYLAALTSSGVAFYDGNGNAASNIVAAFGSSGAQIGKTGETHLGVTSSAVEILSATLQVLLSLSKQTRNIDGTDTDLGAITSAMPLLLEHVGVGTSRLYMADGSNPNKELTRLVEVLGNYTAEIEANANASLGAEAKLTATSTQGGIKTAQVDVAASSSGSLINLQGDEILVGFAEPIAYADKTVTVSSTSHGTNFTTSVSISKTGYTPLGVIDWWWDSGTRQNYFNAWGVFTYGNTLYVRLCNLHPSDAASGSFTARVVYVRNELL